VWVTGAGLAALSAGSAAVALGSGVVQAAALGAAVLVLGRIGRPADRPLISPAVTRHRVEKLTSDMVIGALTSIGIGAITSADKKNPGAISFPAPITRDGPGWRADVDLPRGVTVADVLERRPRLASALRRPLGCVWPEGDSAIHEGRLILWVGDKDLSRSLVRFALAKAASHDVFKGVPMGADPRGRAVTVPLIQHNVLIGSQPGQGKTGSAAALACGAALDPPASYGCTNSKDQVTSTRWSRSRTGSPPASMTSRSATPPGPWPRSAPSWVAARPPSRSSPGRVPGQASHPQDRRPQVPGFAPAGLRDR
jgi:S-DNA-T family DNA segregation ATPase FtsK/SpoIIIE